MKASHLVEVEHYVALLCPTAPRSFCFQPSQLDPMQPSHAATLGRAPRVPRTPQVLRPAPRGAAVAKAPAVPRSSLAFAAVTGAIAWKTWTARRQRAPQQVEKMNTKKLGLEVSLCQVWPGMGWFLIVEIWLGFGLGLHRESGRVV